jgi:Spy/CpxP family protein refolding chaperone
MKKVFVASILLMFAFMVSAQGRGGGGQMSPEQQAQRYETMKKDLGLNDTQLAGIKKIEEEYQPKMRELFQTYGDDREKMMAERTKLMNERNEKVKPLISAEQYTKYVEMANQQRGPGGGGGNR